MSARPRPPTTDAEWKERFDPEGVYQEQMLSILQETRDEIAYKSDLPQERRMSPTVFQAPTKSDPKISAT